LKVDEIRVISVEDRDGWEAEHERDGLPSQSWGYADALRLSGFDPHLAVIHAGGSRMLMPFFERAWKGHTDVATTPGLSGASMSGASAAPLELWREHARERGWVAGYIQLAVSAAPEGLGPADELVATNDVFLIDLRGDRHPLRSASRTVRDKVRKADAQGTDLIDDRDALAEALVELYPATMRRGGGTPPFAAETLAGWARDPTSLVLGAKLGHSIEAALVVCVAGTQSEAHVVGTTESGRELATWLYSQAIAKLRERGIETWNFGGGVRRGDGLHRYKERWGASAHPLRAVRQIYDAPLYDQLCEQAGVPRTISWFPAYRAIS
jgi:hypothetical protein